VNERTNRLDLLDLSQGLCNPSVGRCYSIGFAHLMDAKECTVEEGKRPDQGLIVHCEIRSKHECEGRK
jgi:hypothetical protein